VGVLGYFIYQNTQLRSGSVNPSSTITNSVTNLPKPSPSFDPTADWKTYTFPKIGVSLKMPDLWFVHPEEPFSETMVEGKTTNTTVYTTFISYPVDNSSPQVWENGQKASITISTGTKTETLDKRSESYTERGFDPLALELRKEIDGQNAIFLLDNKTMLYRVVLIDKGQTSYYISISFPNTKSAQEVSSVFDQILSTFKFLGQSVTISSDKAVETVSNMSEVKTFLAQTPKAVVGVDQTDSTDKYWAVQVFESFPDHNVTFHWYNVDKVTGVITKQI